VKHLLALGATFGLAAAAVVAQSPDTPPWRSFGSAPGWEVPRTPDGHPDLQGVWGNNHVTPITRPRQWKDKQSLTEVELQELKGLFAQYVDQGGDAIFTSVVQMVLDAKEKGEIKQISYDPTTGNYEEYWMSGREFDTRTSLVVDPPDGQIPALTPEAQAQRKQTFAAGFGSSREDGPEDYPLSERCISYGAPYQGAGYNAYFQIVQSPEAVVLLQEMIHDARTVPMDGRPHLPASVRQLHGDSRGHWEGDTLVVETTNYINGFRGSTPNVRLTERYTRASEDFINWEITVDDPATWEQSWTLMVRLKRASGQLYEYACHEGNYSMAGMLAGARRAEQKAAEAAAKSAR
jgi:hypothetical protein